MEISPKTLLHCSGALRCSARINLVKKDGGGSVEARHPEGKASPAVFKSRSLFYGARIPQWQSQKMHLATSYNQKLDKIGSINLSMGPSPCILSCLA